MLITSKFMMTEVVSAHKNSGINFRLVPINTKNPVITLSLSQWLIKNLLSPNFSFQWSEKINRNTEKAVLYDCLPKITGIDKQVLLLLLLPRLFFFSIISLGRPLDVWAELWAQLPPSYLLHEDKKRLAVVLPLLRQLTLMREFVTAHVHRQLKAVGVQIAEIIHTCQKNKQETQHRYMSVGQRQLRSPLHPTYWQ